MTTIQELHARGADAAKRARLFNCCTDYAAPDWSTFASLELAGCVTEAIGEDDETTIGGQMASDAEFFTVYGRLHTGEHDAITDIQDARDALAVAGELALLSGLPCLVSATLGA